MHESPTLSSVDIRKAQKFYLKVDQPALAHINLHLISVTSLSQRKEELLKSN